ncbi:sigma-54-dependent transcriptional regulator [Nibricoccus sp. IMCC34717]|uniref:sigma-54-dependent transcriptional regulator n=1 Tax=Nibricoccus sp. IMCC34717 TaxID=3034021 RepID=UPI003850B97F
MATVLIVDDLLSIHEMLDAVIQPTGFATAFATDGEKALARFKTERQDIVLADIDMKPMDGLTLLKHLKQIDPHVVVIIMTAYANTDSALQALKYGAFDYLQKPFRVDELISTLRRGIDYKTALATDVAQPAKSFSEEVRLEHRLVGSSAKFTKVVQQIRRLATVRTPALIHGEPGTGKTTVADTLHASGPHPDQKFVKADCNSTQLESLRAGLIGQGPEGGKWIQDAKGGTLCLHHLHCLPLALQKEFVTVLRNTAHTFRLIATTTEDLETLTDEGKFNDDLFYRVAALPVVLPPLRERPEDIPELIHYFTSKTANPFFDSTMIEFTDDALDVLRAYHWPGNVTELHQVVSKIAASSEQRVITSEHLPMRLKELKQWPSLAEYLAGQQRSYVDSVLRAARGDKAKAAKILGIAVDKIG